MERRLAAILAADVVGYSRMMGIDEVSTLSSMKTARSVVIDPTILEHDGTIFKLMGDGMLVEFPSVVEATKCAIEVQQKMIEHNRASPDEQQITLRIGINIGDVIAEDGDIYGDGVNVAARLEAIAEIGGVCISDFAHDQVQNRIHVHFSDGGDRLLKNIARPLRVWNWTPTGLMSQQSDETTGSTLKQPSKPSIAVLPFKSLGSDEEQRFFADGIAEDIISALSRARWLFVISRNSSFAFEGRGTDVRTVSKELGVRYVLEGTVRKSGDRLRVAASLSEPGLSRQLWADRYDGTTEDIFDFQDQVTHQIVSTLQPNVLDAEAERSRKQRPENLDCWDCVVRARTRLWTWEQQGCEEARSLLERALSLDPNYGLAHSKLAYVFVLAGWMGWEADVSGCISKSVSEAESAIELDPADSWAHIALGMSYGLQRKNTEAVEELNKAIEFDPNSSIARAMLGMIKCWGGDGDGGIAEFDKALRSNPRDPFNRVFGSMYATAHWVEGRYEDALPAALESVRKMPNAVVANRALAGTYMMLGRKEEAVKAFAIVKRLQPGFSSEWGKEHMPFTEGEHLDRWIDVIKHAGY